MGRIMGTCLFIGIAGGSGSGKTTIARNLAELFDVEDAILLEQDAYYKELDHLSLDERAKTNFDHPDAIEFELLEQHLRELANGNQIERPIYNFKTHAREKETKILTPARIVIVEGILVLAMRKIRKLLDIKVFVDTDADEMLLRRIERDIKERGRTLESVRDQYLATVKPMYLKYCEPSKRYADVIVPEGGKNKVAVNMLINHLRDYLQKGE
ncbi:uridine kinase [Sediminitomix flava]|uniref:Uridine kinase n=1 Tax=Sediminitomix flava TaxID=379075 RepID=A0A315Z6M7_SEDFL|nr:uridine kinase [Sediminitomix flava]PWJ39304.1 uridine kinase [Sediminitomix flava]